MGEELLGSNSSTSTTAIDSSNIGFQLLKKHGWKEGTGLGVSEQGRLEPLQACLKNNKRGLGADKVKKRTPKPLESLIAKDQNEKFQEHSPSKKSKTLSKKQRKMQQLEKHLQEKEFERAFYREFWPDNV
ncbi:protein pxr1 isoform X3 [Hevea brasiliensis]|nr:protein pxr1 isoform X3 [Hevea brasiliensis]XP_058008415.1 protein pxr1 isoform X3 [Hevea brasiliensis]